LNNVVLTQEQIALLNSMSKEQLQAAGISLSTRKEKSPEDILKTEQREAFWAFMESTGAAMKNATWICMCNEHMNAKGIRAATYNEGPMLRHIIKTGCKESRLVSVELFVKFGVEMLSRKHVTPKYAADNIEAVTKAEGLKKVEKAERELAKAKAALA
jgi:hypothetical protein